jgi:hypothetical protein
MLAICRIATATVSAALLASGCGTYETVGRPPTVAEIARINAIAARGRGMKVDYDDAGPCAGGSCVGGSGKADAAARGELVIRPVSVASCDDRQITFNTAAGATRTIPTARVKGLKVSAADRDRTMLLGGSLGAAVGLVAALSIYILAHADFPDQSVDAHPTCGTGCDALIIGFPVVTTIVAGVIGHLIGSPRTFLFDDSALESR